MILEMKISPLSIRLSRRTTNHESFPALMKSIRTGSFFEPVPVSLAQPHDHKQKNPERVKSEFTETVSVIVKITVKKIRFYDFSCRLPSRNRFRQPLRWVKSHLIQGHLFTVDIVDPDELARF